MTGTPAEIRDVAKRYGIYYKKTPRGDVDHTFLTSLVDRNGILRVQYMGVKFNPDEMLRDLQSLVNENKAAMKKEEILLAQRSAKLTPRFGAMRSKNLLLLRACRTSWHEKHTKLSQFAYA